MYVKKRKKKDRSMKLLANYNYMLSWDTLIMFKMISHSYELLMSENEYARMHLNVIIPVQHRPSSSTVCCRRWGAASSESSPTAEKGFSIMKLLIERKERGIEKE